MHKNISKVALKGAGEATSNYRFQTVWWTPASMDRIWEVMADYASWPA